MGKVIYRGLRNSDDVILSPVSIITGANLRKRTPKPDAKKGKEQKMESKDTSGKP